MVIRPEPLTKAGFSSFGEIIETDEQKFELINNGNTRKYANLATIDTDSGSQTAISIYRSKAANLPIQLKMMERHPLASQAFFPLHNRPFPVVVAPPGAAPKPEELRAFLSNGYQGINLHAGVWHHYQISLGQESDYLVVDRAGSDNCDVVILAGTVFLQI